ncbi:50S ribosomal protein L4 [Microbacterium sorbitolivorans]|uniref:Large ribosomal subunit protein uL4 n=1 Tax=Microbacterium sorbitolivorans TaxID=1867410 RepID=A0A367XU42_9MICO|nr:50S ribosomal protein L4 [Microbacterium sorbitolivorans]RCK56909.1 50S ribosomal protein L4 [Microbacterium sorbitolivorans]GGF49713.1 50S ribosomal protein L4 [Microbacterium sorbitolivorans]
MADSTLVLDVLGTDGKKTGTVELPAHVFDVKTNVPLIHQVVTAQLAAARQGTHSTLRRGEVSGTGAKPFKQKGTGRSRQGSIRQPEHRGGGIVHGPKPRDYSQRTPKKMIAAAIHGLLSDRLRGERIHVVDTFGTEKPATQAAAKFLSTFTENKKTLVVLGRDEEISYLSVRNLGNVHTLVADQLNAYDIVRSDDVVFTKAAIDAFIAQKAGAKEVSA